MVYEIIFFKFPIRNAVCSELIWTHCRSLLRVESDEARNRYLEEAICNQWSSRLPDRQISTLYYERLLMCQNKTAARQEADEKLSDVA